MAATRNQIFESTRNTVVRSVINFCRRPQNIRPNFQILDLIMPTERRIRSIVGGLETSLGTTLWEPLSKELALLNGFEIIEHRLQAPQIMPANLSQTLSIINSERLDGNQIYSAEYCHDQIKRACQPFLNNPIQGFVNPPSGYGVDIWLRKDGVDYLFDTKTVQPNVGAYTKYLNQLMNWYAYYYSRYPSGNASARIVFPYNPYNDQDFWARAQGHGFPLIHPDEAWVEGEYWDFITGLEGAYAIIYEVFQSIAESRELETSLRELFYR
jgi:hypothetical protein